jgi:hypothetical protein
MVILSHNVGWHARVLVEEASRLQQPTKLRNLNVIKDTSALNYKPYKILDVLVLIGKPQAIIL